uniref:Uncharacterized protein n=1 Tax=Onchocerca volvulus TaxID=6282 RepID=A0A8R1TQD7_ONCVO
MLIATPSFNYILKLRKFHSTTASGETELNGFDDCLREAAAHQRAVEDIPQVFKDYALRQHRTLSDLASLTESYYPSVIIYHSAVKMLTKLVKIETGLDALTFFASKSSSGASIDV